MIDFSSFILKIVQLTIINFFMWAIYSIIAKFFVEQARADLWA
jgi:hypothetical protein